MIYAFNSIYENFFTLLLSIDDKVGSGDSKEKKYSPYKTVLENSPQYYKQSPAGDPSKALKKVEDSRKDVPGQAKGSNPFSTLKNITYNAIDNTIGYPIAVMQNYRTRKELKTDKSKPIAYLMPGVFQNKGSQWRFARDLKEQGFTPYHISGSHFFGGGEGGIDKSVKKAYNQIEKLHKKTGITKDEAYKRKDYFSGHSSGANVGIHMSGRNETADYGIKHIQARAPTPYGLHVKNTYQKTLGKLLDLKGEDLKYKSAQKNATRVYQMPPVVPVHVIAGKYDKLVPPKDAFYVKAKSYKIIDSKDSGHFGTSGVNSTMNQLFIDEMKGYNKMYDKETNGKQQKKAA